MLELANGNLSVSIPYAQKRDEIGAIAQALDIFRRAGLRNRELEQEAENARGALRK